jgi:hypothetical protein
MSLIKVRNCALVLLLHLCKGAPQARMRFVFLRFVPLVSVPLLFDNFITRTTARLTFLLLSPTCSPSDPPSRHTNR